MSSPELSTRPCNQEVPAQVQRSRPNCAWEVGITMLTICLSGTWEEPTGGRGLKSASPLYHPDPRAPLISGSALGAPPWGRGSGSLHGDHPVGQAPPAPSGEGWCLQQGSEPEGLRAVRRPGLWSPLLRAPTPKALSGFMAWTDPVVFSRIPAPST